MLNTSHISVVGHVAALLDQPEDRLRRRAARRSGSRRSSFSRSRLSSPSPVMCARPCTSHVRAQQVQRGAHVDLRRLEQLLGERAAELRRRVVERQAALLEQRASREREAVRVHAARGHADHDVAGLDRARRSGSRSRGTTPIAAPTRSMPCGEGWPSEHLGHLRELAAGDLDARPARRRRAGPRRSAASTPGRPARRRCSRPSRSARRPRRPGRSRSSRRSRCRPCRSAAPARRRSAWCRRRRCRSRSPCRSSSASTLA